MRNNQNDDRSHEEERNQLRDFIHQFLLCLRSNVCNCVAESSDNGAITHHVNEPQANHPQNHECTSIVTESSDDCKKGNSAQFQPESKNRLTRIRLCFLSHNSGFPPVGLISGGCAGEPGALGAPLAGLELPEFAGAAALAWLPNVDHKSDH
jgi:hypothetical protein